MQSTLDQETLVKLEGSSTSTIANILLKKGFGNAYLLGISPLDRNQPKMVGPAYTLRFIPAREDLDGMGNYSRDDNLHRVAIEECPEGSVLVIDACDCISAASMGDMMARRLKARKVSGVVTNGGYRDVSSILELGLPCYQRQTAPPATPIALHPVDLNVPVGSAGVAVYPADIVVGDGDGVVIIPRHMVRQVAIEAEKQESYEEFASLKIQGGRSILGLFPPTDESLKEYDGWVSD